MIRFGVVAMVLLVSACNEKSEDGVTRGTTAAKRDIADRQVEKLAYEGYGIWATRPANAGKCPTVAQLAETAGVGTVDPWGAELTVKCDDLPPGVVGVAVSSRGPDGKAGTPDDVLSWDD
jgi:hypothetical protein